MNATTQIHTHRPVALDIGLGVLVGVLSAIVTGFVTLALTVVPGIFACAACLWGVARIAEHRGPRRWYHLWLPVGLGFALVQTALGLLLGRVGAEGWIVGIAYLMVGVVTVPVAAVLLIGGLIAALTDRRREPATRSSAEDRMVFGAGLLGLGLLGFMTWSWFA